VGLIEGSTVKLGESCGFNDEVGEGDGVGVAF